MAIEDDDMGLLDVKAKPSAPTADEHLISKFNEINEFITANNREPEADMANVPEYMLSQRLNSIRQNSEQCQALAPIDTHNLLPAQLEQQVAEPGTDYQVEEKEINSVDDIFADDDLGLLDTPADSIFDLKHVEKFSRAEAEHISRRKKCKDFEKYEHLFVEVQKQIRDGERKLLPFDDKGESLVAGCYYILSGVLLFLESVDITSPEKTIKGKRFRKDGRTRCIFENGTESNMLYRSLAKALYNDGKIVSETNDSLNDELYKNMGGVTEEDTESGYIYILSSLSKNPDIQNVNNLHKIGYSTTSIEKRIANAENEATYLMAPVKLITGYQCYNINSQKFENLLHIFFGNACLDIEVADKQGKMRKPKEWFIAPLEAIEFAVNGLLDGSIVNYRYDAIREKVVKK
jgi:hypothetical protein